MAREHIYVRADKKAYVVAFRQVENKKRPRVYETFNFKKCGGKENALAKAQLYHSQQMAKQARGMTTAAKVTATFEEAANRWHKHGLAKGWRKSTATDYRSVLDFRLIPAFGHLQLPRLTEPKVEDWLEEIRPQVSARTVHKLLFIASAVMKRAAKDYPGFEGNPFAAVDAGTTSDHSDHPWFSDEEVWAIIRAAESEQLRAIILTAWRAGLRLGEIPVLRIKDDVDVDCDEPFIIVNRNLVLGVVNETPKGKRPRRVPLDRDGDLVKALAQVLNARGNPGRGELVFPADDGGMLSPDGISYRFRKARDTANVRPLGFHSLRHSFVTRLAQSGVHVTDIQAWAGHVSLATTQGYMHHAPNAGDGKIIGAPFRPEPIEPEAALETVLERKVGELTVEELAQALARIREEG